MAIQMLHCEVDEDEESYFRFLVDGSHVKYVTVDAHVFANGDMTFAPVFIPMLPSLPPGDWNEGRISKGADGKPFFSSSQNTKLPAITPLWHSSKVEVLSLQLQFRGSTNLCSVRSSSLPMLAKFARFPWEVDYYHQETAAYRWVQGHGIAPRFLGHLMEHGRAMGFLLEEIRPCRHARPSDLKACQEVLRRLHRLGIKHGDINRHNFLICNGKAVLIDLESAECCNDRKMLEQEMSQLPEQLASQSSRGRPANMGTG